MIRKFAAEILQNAKNRPHAELCQILRMVTIEIVINSIHVMGIRVTISCRYCIAFQVMLLFLVSTLQLLKSSITNVLRLLFTRATLCIARSLPSCGVRLSHADIVSKRLNPS